MAGFTVTQIQFIDTVTQASSQLASGWSEAASRYTNWVTSQQAIRLVSESEKYNKFAAELGAGFQQATTNARIWEQAARDAGNTGIANIMQKYADNFASKAANLLDQGLDARATLNGIATEAKLAAQQAGDIFGGNLGRFIGPAFDAAQMITGAVDWANTGNSDKFGGAAMGVLLSAGFGIAGAALLPFVTGSAIIIAIGAGIGALIGAASGDAIYAEFRDSPIVADIVNSLFTAARGWTFPRDPLVLDLDGDGIETVGINPLAPILFDHDADGIKTGTGWVGSDDGLLVLDLNGNGTIDSGRELFGDNTALPGNASLAVNGYQALAQHDSNLDGKINSLDAAYSQLRIWRDLNQDGISQAGELQTLQSLGIASIGVAGTTTNTNLGGGNTQIASGSFTRTDGSAGHSGVAELSGSLLLAGNDFYRSFTDNPVPTAAALALPQMYGSGWVRDLRVAMSLGDAACRRKIRFKYHSFSRNHLRACKARLYKSIQTKQKPFMQKQADGLLKISFALEGSTYIDQENLCGVRNHV
jgi:hypothetical protein